MNSFGKYLRKMRKRRRISLKKIADTMNVSIAYIHQLETGKSSPPGIERCRQLADALGEDFDDIWRVACSQRIEKSAGTSRISKNEPKPLVLNPSERKVIQLMRAMDKDTRMNLMGLMRSLIIEHPNQTMLILMAELLDTFD